MPSPANQRMTIGDFLLRRLREARVRHVFGVPGDYNLELLQQLQDSAALQWVGTTGLAVRNTATTCSSGRPHVAQRESNRADTIERRRAVYSGACQSQN
jgi:Thiamine pyrophosphate enzyme, N-terminal TPP binding domain